MAMKTLLMTIGGVGLIAIGFFLGMIHGAEIIEHRNPRIVELSRTSTCTAYLLMDDRDSFHFSACSREENDSEIPDWNIIK